ANFVGVTFGNGLGRKLITAHAESSLAARKIRVHTPSEGHRQRDGEPWFGSAGELGHSSEAGVARWRDKKRTRPVRHGGRGGRDCSLSTYCASCSSFAMRAGSNVP